MKRVILIVLVTILCISICGCGNQNSAIKSLTSQFENACNKVDLNEMLDCMKPEVSESVKKLTGLIGMFSDKDSDELLDKFAKTIFKGLPENSQEFFSSIKISVKDVKIEEDNAFATAEITYNISGEDYKKDADFEYARIDKKWYISNLDIK